ncbi:hypothetical protein JXO59_14895 [candidate division KSB1 bacterium]|nr:hypothetical protein [candidate division KSB1 bacterium]
MKPDNHIKPFAVHRYGKSDRRGFYPNLPIFGAALLAIQLISGQMAGAQQIDWQGQIVSWALYDGEEAKHSQVGARFIPALYAEKALSKEYRISAEVALHAYGFHSFAGWNRENRDGELKPYRCYLRLSSAQLEVRAGLQKINFGSALLLRPLMWFDRIDPRDPLQLTDGVYGLLVRYYFLNNANLWLWGLYGNDDLKGWEVIPGDAHKLEYGGRIQLPLATGEIGFSYHHRQMDLQKGLLNAMPLGTGSAPEQRLALDGKWDVGIGCWFEAVLVHRRLQWTAFAYQNMVNIGADYTFGLGNGLHLAGEYLLLATGEEALEAEETYSFSALSAGYPFGILDMFQGMVFYDWENRDWYRFINWSRTYDRWQINLMGYWNPEQFLLYQNQQSFNAFNGKGLQVMVVYNF